MNFGIINSNAAAGKVVLGNDGSRTPTTVTLAPSTGTFTPSAATFTVTGEKDYFWTVTLPTTPLTIGNGTTTMTVSDFTNDGGTKLSNSTFTLGVGATLNLSAGQASGVYNSATDFSVTVAYN